MASGRPTKVGLSPTRFALIGSELIAFTLLGVLADWITGWLPWTTVAMTLLGLAAVMIQLARAVLSGSAKSGAPQKPGP